MSEDMHLEAATKSLEGAKDEFSLFRGLSAVADAIVSRARFANNAGKTFAGARDLYEVAGYQRNLTITEYRDRYKRNAVAARIVEAKPLDTWRGGFEVIDKPKDLENLSPFEKAFDELNKKLKITSVLQKADVLAGLGYYSVILIGAPGKMETPLSKAPEILYLSVFGEDDAQIKEFDIDEKSPRFGLPVFYELKRTAPKTATATNVATLGKKVHFSRILHVADGLLDDAVFGTPRMERVWNLLDDLEKVTAGGAEAFWMRANQGMHVNIDASLNPSVEELDRMTDDVEKYRHRMSRVIRSRGANINMLGSDTADFKGPQSAIMDQISAGTGIPQRVLTGSEQGKMASEQDSVKYYRMIESRRVEYAEAQVARPFIDRLIELTTLPEPEGDNYSFNWTQLRTRDDDEKAELAKDWATLNNLTQTTVVTRNEIREKCLDLPPISDEDLPPEEIADGNKKPGEGLPAEGESTGGLPSDQIRQGPDARKATAQKVSRTITRDRRGLVTSIEEVHS